MSISARQRRTINAARPSRAPALPMTAADLVLPPVYGITPNDTLGRQIWRMMRPRRKLKTDRQ